MEDKLTTDMNISNMHDKGEAVLSAFSWKPGCHIVACTLSTIKGIVGCGFVGVTCRGGLLSPLTRYNVLIRLIVGCWFWKGFFPPFSVPISVFLWNNILSVPWVKNTGLSQVMQQLQVYVMTSCFNHFNLIPAEIMFCPSFGHRGGL